MRPVGSPKSRPTTEEQAGNHFPLGDRRVAGVSVLRDPGVPRIEKEPVVFGGLGHDRQRPRVVPPGLSRNVGSSRQAKRLVEGAEPAPAPAPPEWLRLARHLLLLAAGYGTVVAIDHAVARWLAVLVYLAWFGPFFIQAAARHLALILLGAAAARSTPRGKWPLASCLRARRVEFPRIRGAVVLPRHPRFTAVRLTDDRPDFRRNLPHGCPCSVTSRSRGNTALSEKGTGTGRDLEDFQDVARFRPEPVPFSDRACGGKGGQDRAGPEDFQDVARFPPGASPIIRERTSEKGTGTGRDLEDFQDVARFRPEPVPFSDRA